MTTFLLVVFIYLLAIEQLLCLSLSLTHTQNHCVVGAKCKQTALTCLIVLLSGYISMINRFHHNICRVCKLFLALQTDRATVLELEEFLLLFIGIYLL